MTVAAPSLGGASEGAGQPSPWRGDPLQVPDAGETGAANRSGAAELQSLAMPEPAGRGAEIGPVASSSPSASQPRLAPSPGSDWMTAQPTRSPEGGFPDSVEVKQTSEEPADRGAVPDRADIALDEHLPGPRRDTTAIVAGFWERLLTGLSGPVPGDPSERSALGPMGAGVGRREGAEGAWLSGAAAVAKAAHPAVVVSAASGVAVFARSQARLATLSPDSAPERGLVDPALATLSLPPGSLPPGLSLSQASATAPAQFPAPQVAAQITAALSQSADGVTELALSPEELGRVRLRLEQDAKHPDRMVVHITFERPETMDLFRRHAGELAEALREAGYAGADIGFGQQGGSAETPHRDGTSAGPDYGSSGAGPAEARGPEPTAPRRMAGASLDLRL
jgi:hypothetical protein